MKYLGKTLLTLIFAAGFSLSAAAQDARTGDYYDPIESFNRGVFGFNNFVDIYFLDPVTDGYRFVVPDGGRSMVSNFIRNLREPLNIANNLLQGDLDGAYNSTFRMITNSFAGFGGLLDVAGREGYIYEYESLDQTLAVYGLPQGPYLVLPLIGPGSTSGHASLFAEGFADPFNRWAINTDQEEWIVVRQATQVLNSKDQFVDVQRDLRVNSSDYYAAVRNILFQQGQNLIYEGRAPLDASSEIPDYDEDF